MKTESAIAAKSIKTELKKAFPEIVFSVKSKNYSMGDSVTISWENGPTAEEVEKLVGRYQYGYFNGMEDIYEYNRDREETTGSTKYLHFDREISEDGRKAIAKSLCELNGVEFTPSAWNERIHGEYLSTLVHRIMCKKSIPAGKTIAGLEVSGGCGLIENVYNVVLI